MLRLRDVLTTGLSTVASGGLGLLVAVVAARLLGPDQNGHFAQYLVVLNLVCLALGLGLGPASTQFLASGRWSDARVVSVNRRFLAGAVVLVLATIALAGMTNTALLLERALSLPTGVAAAAALGGVAMLALNQAAAVWMGRHAYAVANLVAVLRTGAPLLPVMIACALLPQALAAATAQTIALALAAALAWVRIRPAADSGPAGDQSLKGLVAYGGIAYLANLLHYLAIRGLLLLLSYHAAPATVGYANLALLLLEALLLLPSAIGQLLFPQSSQASFDRAAMESVLRLSVLVALVAAVAVAALAPLAAVLLLGAPYAEVGTALRHLAPSIVLMTVPRILSPVLAGQGRPQVPLAGAALSVVVGAPLAAWLMPAHGLVGTAWVFNAVALCTALVMVQAHSRSAGSRWSALLLPRASELAGWWSKLQRAWGRRHP